MAIVVGVAKRRNIIEMDFSKKQKLNVMQSMLFPAGTRAGRNPRWPLSGPAHTNYLQITILPPRPPTMIVKLLEAEVLPKF